MKSLRELLRESAAKSRERAGRYSTVKTAHDAAILMEHLAEAEALEGLLARLSDEEDAIADFAEASDELASALGSWSSNPAEQGRYGVIARALTGALKEASYRVRA